MRARNVQRCANIFECAEREKPVLTVIYPFVDLFVTADAMSAVQDSCAGLRIFIGHHTRFLALRRFLTGSRCAMTPCSI